MRGAFSLILVIAAVGCEGEETSVVLNVRSDTGSTLRIQVCDSEGARVLDRTFDVSDGAPRRVLLVPRGQDETRKFYASLQLQGSIEPLARRRIAGSYTAGERVELDFSLTEECSATGCGQDYACSQGRCQLEPAQAFDDSFPTQCDYDSAAGPDIALAPCEDIDDPDLLFCNDFATGIGEGWSEGKEGGATLTWQGDGAGQFLRSTIDSAGSSAYVGFAEVAELNDAQAFYVRVRMRVSTLDYNYYKPLRLIAEDSRGRYEIGVSVHGLTSSLTGVAPFLFFAGDNTDGATVAQPEVGQWACLQMHVVQGTPGSVSIALNGQWSDPQEIADAPDQGFEGIRVGAGFVSGGVGVFDVDDFALALRPLTCLP